MRASLALCAAATATAVVTEPLYQVDPEVFERMPEMKKFKNVDFRKNHYDPVKEKSGNPPEQVHIAYAGKGAHGYPTGMNVAWWFSAKTSCVVKYGIGSDLSKTTPAVTNGHEYIGKGGYHYHTDVLDLEPGTKYSYAVSCDSLTTKTFTFTTAKTTNKLDKPYSLSMFGDMGYLGSAERPVVLPVGGMKKHWSAVPTRQTLEKMHNAGEIDGIWHVGDIGYADDAFDTDIVGGQYEKCYDGYMNWFQNITANAPYMVSPGNHESECHSPECVVDFLIGEKLANFSAYNSRFHMPSSVSNGVDAMWYSWNVGPVHFVSLNTETDFPGAGEEKKGDSGIFPAGSFGRTGQYMNWLENDLKQAYADKKSGVRPFIVLGGHRPCCRDIPGVHELIGKYEVDLFVGGHVHTYGRSVGQCLPPACQAKNATAGGKASYVFAGGAGNDETDIITTGPTYNKSNPVFTTPELSSGLLTVYNHTTMRWRLISSFGDNKVLDEFYMHSQ
eukprot:Rhum_TRINITY_DN22954_c0_g1::Rhum_TRINITY_DN22954_c0_g1_i1::g.176741::m.176741